jgi:hypothetical protein
MKTSDMFLPLFSPLSLFLQLKFDISYIWTCESLQRIDLRLSSERRHTTMTSQPDLPEPAHPEVESMLSRRFGKEVANYFSGAQISPTNSKLLSNMHEQGPH